MLAIILIIILFVSIYILIIKNKAVEISRFFNLRIIRNLFFFFKIYRFSNLNNKNLNFINRTIFFLSIIITININNNIF